MACKSISTAGGDHSQPYMGSNECRSNGVDHAVTPHNQYGIGSPGNRSLYFCNAIFGGLAELEGDDAGKRHIVPLPSHQLCLLGWRE